jgi:hypothetical protein
LPLLRFLFCFHLSAYEHQHQSFRSLKQRDACGVCGGNNTTCTGCDGVPNSGKKIDDCGTCGGSGGCSVALSVVARSKVVCLGNYAETSWVAPLNRTSGMSLGVFARSGDSWSFFPSDLCTLIAGEWRT